MDTVTAPAPAETDSSYSRIAIWVGVLYLIATVAPVSTLGAWGTLIDGPGILTNAAANESQLILVALLNLVVAIAVAGVAFMIHPVLKRVADTAVKEGLAAWYVGTRVTEGATFVIAALATLAFLPLSQEFVAAGAPDASHFQANAAVLESTIDVRYALGQTVFAIGAAMLYFLMYTSKIVPRWLSGWGLIASPLFVVASLTLLWTGDPNSTSLHSPLRADGRPGDGPRRVAYIQRLRLHCARPPQVTHPGTTNHHQRTRRHEALCAERAGVDTNLHQTTGVGSGSQSLRRSYGSQVG